MRTLSVLGAVALLTATCAGQTYAQPARIGNIYDGHDHQPGPDGSLTPSEAQTLNQMNAPLQQKAQESASAPEVGKNVYGVQPGNVVPISPTEGHAGSGVAPK